jgi:hypothetical protein
MFPKAPPALTVIPCAAKDVAPNGCTVTVPPPATPVPGFLAKTIPFASAPDAGSKSTTVSLIDIN